MLSKRTVVRSCRCFAVVAFATAIGWAPDAGADPILYSFYTDSPTAPPPQVFNAPFELTTPEWALAPPPLLDTNLFYGEAASGPGYWRALAQQSLTETGVYNNFQITVGSMATDLEVSGSSPDVPVPLSVQLNVDGILKNTVIGYGALAASSFTASVSLFEVGNYFPSLVDSTFSIIQLCVADVAGCQHDVTENTTGSSYTFDPVSGNFAMSLISTPIMANVGVNYGAIVNLTTWVHGETANGSTLAQSIADFSHTMTLPLAGAGFLLPDGYVVNSPSMNVANSQWTPPPSFFDEPEAAPTPDAGALFGLGLIGLLAAHRRRRLAA